MILFFDIDGTLWDYKNYIPKSTAEAIKKARANSHLCFINTGRSRAFVYDKDLLALGFDGIISACGCMIEYEGKTVFNRLISQEDCIRTVDSVKKHGLKPILEGPEYLYMNKEDFMGDMYGEKVIKEMGDRLLSIDDNYGNWTINKLSCNCSRMNDTGCFAELDDLYDFMFHSETVVEMVPKGFNKGTGIRDICRILGTDIKDTVAFGDSINDKEMLEAAGIAVAMGRSSDATKAIADHVTANLEDDGIWLAMKEFGLI